MTPGALKQESHRDRARAQEGQGNLARDKEIALISIMTEESYYKDAYIREMWTKVLAVEGNKILTEKSIFFPKTDDQMSDTGTLDGISLLGVLKQGSEIWHILEKSPKLMPGDDTLLKLNWKKRFNSMRLHTAMHLLSSVLKKHFGIYAKSACIDASGAHMEFAKEIDIQTITNSIAKANEILSAGTEIDTAIDEDTKKRSIRLGYFPPIECDGLFVKDIKEIGSISFLKGDFKNETFMLSVNVD